jgi:hypothetical protein
MTHQQEEDQLSHILTDFFKNNILLGSDFVVSYHYHKPFGTFRATFSAIRSGF